MRTLSSRTSLMQMNKSPNSSPPVSNQREQEEKRRTDSNSLDEVISILPREIWLGIGKRLESRLDVVRFRSVCRTWRSVLPPPLRFPLKVPPPPGRRSPTYAEVSFFIAEVTFYAANDMIVVFEEEYRGGRFSASALVKSQLSKTKFRLPPVSQISKLSFLCNAFHPHNAFPDGKAIDGKCVFIGNLDVLKISIICSDGAANVNPNYPKLRDLKVVAHLSDRKLAVLSLCGGAMNNNWETGFCDISFADIVTYQGQLYGVDMSGRAFVMDYSSLHMTQVSAAVPNYKYKRVQGYRKLLHLAVVSGDLYMFIHEHSRSLDFYNPHIPKLYKLSLRLGQWLEADRDLPDQVFIKNLKCNFPVPKNLIRGHHATTPVPRFCSCPDFEFVRVAVGFKNTYQSQSPRHCDLPQLTYFNRN